MQFPHKMVERCRKIDDIKARILHISYSHVPVHSGVFLLPQTDRVWLLEKYIGCVLRQSLCLYYLVCNINHFAGCRKH